MRSLTGIILHSAATKRSMSVSIDVVRSWHMNPKPDGNGWSDVGYHFYIRFDGSVEVGRPLYRNGAHCKGHNRGAVGICTEGGLGEDGKACDTRTPEQKKALQDLIATLCADYPSIQFVKGHRDFSPDLDGDGVIEESEWMKSCPCYDAIEEYQGLVHC